ncbi:hypothetical protein FUAX_56010 (plasmid) [Fulvitalea axinellae]|uniref:Uncharacterized protein n=1 Tax=Fulvitalea axinellae TaxID=1182444 RepID=A0AAU9CMM3_9BACT|nr:hypothetical protein FUAX_56010 [Fulvitalea axinellae]
MEPIKLKKKVLIEKLPNGQFRCNLKLTQGAKSVALTAEEVCVCSILDRIRVTTGIKVVRFTLRDSGKDSSEIANWLRNLPKWG